MYFSGQFFFVVVHKLNKKIKTNNYNEILANNKECPKHL